MADAQGLKIENLREHITQWGRKEPLFYTDQEGKKIPGTQALCLGDVMLRCITLWPQQQVPPEESIQIGLTGDKLGKALQIMSGTASIDLDEDDLEVVRKSLFLNGANFSQQVLSRVWRIVGVPPQESPEATK